MNILKKIYNKIIFTLGLIRLGDTFADKIKFLQWLYFPNDSGEINFKIKMFGNSISMILPNTRDQLLTLRSIFLAGDWKVDISDPKVIFDFGSYTGISTSYFLLKYPLATIYVFEPSGYNLEYIYKNFINNPRVIINNIAVGSKDGEMNLYTPNNRSISSSLSTNRSDSNVGVQVVKTKTFDTICEGIDNIDLLKFNIEGAEENIFESKAIYTSVKMFIGEVHGDLISKQYKLSDFKKNLSRVFLITERIHNEKKQRGIWFGEHR